MVKMLNYWLGGCDVDPDDINIAHIWTLNRMCLVG